jgi:putative flippase GtrA
MRSNFKQEVFRFIIVGIINTAIDLAVLNLLIAISHKGQSGFYYSFFKGVSFLVAVTNSYFMNKNWTFAAAGKASNNAVHNISRAAQAKKSKIGIERAEFLLISIVGFFVNDLAASFFVNTGSPQASLQKIWPTVAALLATAFGLVWNYIGYKYLVFKKHKPDLELLPPA